MHLGGFSGRFELRMMCEDIVVVGNSWLAGPVVLQDVKGGEGEWGGRGCKEVPRCGINRGLYRVWRGLAECE